MTFYIKAYILDNCPYSIRAYNTLKNLKDVKIEKIPLEKSKQVCKNETGMNTFPQIMLVYKNNNYLIGGNDDLEFLLSIRKNVTKILKQKKLKDFFNEIKQKIRIKNYDIFLMTLIILYQ